MSTHLGNLKKHYNLHNTTLFLPILLISLLVVSIFFYKLAFGWYPAKYTESAHVGVNRSTISSIGYAVGNCTHCHEQHASIEGASHTPYDFSLFAPNNATSQTDNFCFQCHCNPVASKQSGMIENKDYSSTFGGGTAATFTNIYDAFNTTTGSSHNLESVLNYAVSQGWGYTTGNNACTVCHNPHSAQKNFPVSINQTLGGVNTAIEHPSVSSSNPGNLWGDETGDIEIFSEWTGVYQAPYRVGQTTYEPAGNQTTNGSNLPNYVGLCANACHRLSVNGLKAINWTKNVTGFWPGNKNIHGRHVGWLFGSAGAVKGPYIEEFAGGYCLSCLDCHEPHGSTNPFLLRRYVNGTGPITVTVDVNGLLYLWDFCTACHVLSGHFTPSSNCTDGPCHKHGVLRAGGIPTF